MTTGKYIPNHMKNADKKCGFNFFSKIKHRYVKFFFFNHIHLFTSYELPLKISYLQYCNKKFKHS